MPVQGLITGIGPFEAFGSAFRRYGIIRAAGRLKMDH